MRKFVATVVDVIYLFDRRDVVFATVKHSSTPDVFILIPYDVRVALDLLTDTREDVGVPRTNEYVFARFLANTPLAGDEDLQDVLNSCPGLAFPDHIQSTALTKYTATVLQVLLQIFLDFVHVTVNR